MAVPLNAKEQVRRILEQLPDEFSLEDLQHHLYVLQKLHDRSRLADRGQFISQAEAVRRMGKWLR
jgi:hypothetical protein